ncbi:Phthiocerol synthesis polyketide synthase type I PpsD [Mycobacterium talmoniae]|uniref:Phthiocerol synthesis polyketide synthase type I PpsD n=1 Tax=Mycobacterium talmoniae TaxID=1858794 RepID=A0A2S8BME9_9MYCO|nr:Phthiocerol synthesis polyketide synthase type I PpsD [Mycobacterium talmoniae]
MSRGGAAAVLPAAVGAGTAVAAPVQAAAAPTPVEDAPDAEILHDNLTQGVAMGASFAKWSPDSGETVAQRLGTIVGAAMGYEPEDLPWEVPLIELGLDSLMAVRIKNRVEYDFDLPPIQLTAVRDANLYNVEELIKYAVEHRDEVEAMHEHQKTQTAEEIAAEQAAMLSGATPNTVLTAPAPDPQAAATRLLTRALQIGLEKDDVDWLHNSAVKAQMKRMDPSFSEKSLGFKSFSDFLRSRSDLVELDESSTTRMVRLR